MTPGRRLALAVAIVVLVVVPIAGGALGNQSQVVVPAGIAFDAVSITTGKPFGLPPTSLTKREIPPDESAMEADFLRRSLSRVQDGHVRISSSVQLMIQAAYNVSRYQVEGGPAWLVSDRYAIDGRVDGNATPDDLRSMLQSLLADRFQLALRREVRQLPVYELTALNGALKIAPAKESDCTPPNEVRWDLLDLEAPRYFCDGVTRRVLSQWPETRPRPQWPRVTRLEAGRISMPTFIGFLAGDLDRMVIDKTGFTEPFNVLIDFAPPSRPESRLPPFSGPTIFSALEEQLGLSLVASEVPVDVLVIDRVERPVEQ